MLTLISIYEILVGFGFVVFSFFLADLFILEQGRPFLTPAWSRGKVKFIIFISQGTLRMYYYKLVDFFLDPGKTILG